MQIDFSATSDRVNIRKFSMNSALWELEVLCCLFLQFPSNQSQHVIVDCCWSKLVNVVSGLSQGSVLTY